MAAAITTSVGVAQDPAYTSTRPLLGFLLLGQVTHLLLGRSAACRDTVAVVTSQPRATPMNGPARDFRALADEPTLDFDGLRRDLGVTTDFPADVIAQAQHTADAAAHSTAASDSDAVDRTDIPFVTVDPLGARDLDQALHIERRDGGYLVSYAIADVAAFVVAGSALDDETRRRGETLYFPDLRVPLHPAVLSEGAASLLPGQVRPAVLWAISLDATGQTTAVDVRRARVRSVAQLDYGQLQQMLDAGAAPVAAELLGEVGRARLALARARHAINLDLPEQEVAADDHGGWRLQWRMPLPVESWNAEISLLTGMCAGEMMLRAGVGLLRTLPAPDHTTVSHLARLAPALGVSWPPGARPGDVLAGLDRADPRHVAFFEHAASLLRGAGYTAFDGSAPSHPEHAGVGAVYAHVTAPLRRLVDRFGTEVCLAVAAGVPVPDWAREALPGLPAIMAAADHHAHEVDRAVVDTVEAWLLREQIGHDFDAVVVDARAETAHIALDDPPVRASCDGHQLREGSRIRARLAMADVAARQVRFTAVEAPAATDR